MDSTEIKVSTKPKDTVKMLKDEIYKVSLLKYFNFDNNNFKIQQIKIEPERQRLIFQGKQLKDPEFIGQHKVSLE